MTFFTRGSAVLADGMLIIFTLMKTLHHWRQARRLNLEVKVTTFLLSQGWSSILLRVSLRDAPDEYQALRTSCTSIHLLSPPLQPSHTSQSVGHIERHDGGRRSTEIPGRGPGLPKFYDHHMFCSHQACRLPFLPLCKTLHLSWYYPAFELLI